MNFYEKLFADGQQHMFLKSSENSWKNTSVGVSFSIKVAVLNFIKKEIPTLVFSGEFQEIF